MAINVRTDADGRTRYTVVVRNKFTGKRKSYGTYSSRRDAERAERLAKTQIETKGFSHSFKDIAVEDMVAKHLTSRSATLSPDTLDTYESYFDHFKAFVGKATPLSEVRHETAEQFVSHLVQKGLAPDTVNMIAVNVGAMFKTAKRYGYVSLNPFEGVQNRPKRRTMRDIRALSPDEHRQLVEAFHPHFRLLIECWPYIAARPSEVYALQVGDYDADEKTLGIERQYRNGAFTGLKHDAKPRTLFLDDETAGLIEEQIASNADRAANAPLFPTVRGKIISINNFSVDYLRKALVAADMDTNMSPHALRHTGATWLLESGASVMYVAKHLGHSSPAITMRVYADLLDDVDKTAMTRMRSWRSAVGNAASAEQVERVVEQGRQEVASTSAASYSTRMTERLAELIRRQSPEMREAILRGMREGME